jgi:hypothetical protein
MGVAGKLSFTASVPIAQWQVNTTYVGLNEPFCLSNSESTPNANGVVGKTYNGFDGSPIVADTQTTYYDMTVPRALLPNEVPMLELYSPVTKDWISANEAGVPSLFISSFKTFNTTGATGNAYGTWITKSLSGQIRVYFYGLGCIGLVDWTNASSTITARSWASIIAAADGFTRWRVRIGKSSGVAEIAPTVSVEATCTAMVVAADAQINFNNVSEDPNRCITTGTGAWKFTASVPGKYLITGAIGYASEPSGARAIQLYKGGVAELNKLIELSGMLAYGQKSFSFQIRLKVGEYFDLRSVQYGETYSGSIQITRLGG